MCYFYDADRFKLWAHDSKWRKWRFTLYNGHGTMEVTHQKRFIQPFMDVVNNADKLTVDDCNFITEVKMEN